MGARLIAANGARVEVSDERADRLLGQGFRAVDEPSSDDKPKATRTRRAKKTDEQSAE